MSCHHFVLPQREEDKVLEVLVRKTETIERELGSLSKVIDDDVERRLRGGIRHPDADRLKHVIEVAGLDEVRRQITAEELEAARDRRDDLTEQVERCRGRLERSRTWVGFEAEPFRDALSCALELLGAQPLVRDGDGNGVGQGRATWTFPALDRRTGADPTWAATLDTLRTPHRRDRKLADWRREACGPRRTERATSRRRGPRRACRGCAALRPRSRAWPAPGNASRRHAG